jgi:glutamate racemase
VELVEAGEVEGPRVEAILRERLAPIIEAKARGLLLGCTHYPYLARSLRRVLGPDVVLISPAEETAFDVREGLISLGLDNTRGHGSVRFWCTGDPEVFRRIGTRLYPEPLEVVEHLDLAVLASVWRASA